MGSLDKKFENAPASQSFEINAFSLYVFVLCVLSDRGLHFTEWIAFLLFSISGRREGGRVTGTNVRETRTCPLFLTLYLFKSSPLTDMFWFCFIQRAVCLEGFSAVNPGAVRLRRVTTCRSQGT